MLAFSVIIPTYNRPQILTKTLDCLEQQEVDFDYEVVVDDCSTIHLPELGFGEERRVNWKLLRNEKNSGRAATRNRGIREAQGEFILMIDDDIWATPGLLQAHYEAQQRIGDGVVVGSMPISEEIKDDIWNNFYRNWINEIHKQMEEQKNDLPYNFFFTGNVSMPKVLIEKSGLFDESFKGYSGEDTEVGYRLKKTGTIMCYEPVAMGKHYSQETLGSILKKREQMGAASFNLARKHPELSVELSVAGLLAPGRKYYQIFLSKPLLNIGKVLCNILAILKFNNICLRFLSNLCVAYSALGLKIAVNGK